MATVNAEIWGAIRAANAARRAYYAHWDPCRICGTGAVGLGLCAAGMRLHVAYVKLENRINLTPR